MQRRVVWLALCLPGGFLVEGLLWLLWLRGGTIHNLNVVILLHMPLGFAISALGLGESSFVAALFIGHALIWSALLAMLVLFIFHVRSEMQHPFRHLPQVPRTDTTGRDGNKS